MVEGLGRIHFKICRISATVPTCFLFHPNPSVSFLFKLQVLLPQMCRDEGGFFFVVYCSNLALASGPI